MGMFIYIVRVRMVVGPTIPSAKPLTCCFAMSDELIPVLGLIHEIRGKKVMLDSDLAKLYHVETRSLNQAVKRNAERFPPDFMFQITAEEWMANTSQSVMTSNRPKKALPFAFTREGISMLSSVLRSKVAIQANIRIMRAFVQMNEFLLTTATISAEMKELRAKIALLQHQYEGTLAAVNDLSEDVQKDLDNLYLAIGQLATKLEAKKKEPHRKIGF